MKEFDLVGSSSCSFVEIDDVISKMLLVSMVLMMLLVLRVSEETHKRLQGKLESASATKTLLSGHVVDEEHVFK